MSHLHTENKLSAPNNDNVRRRDTVRYLLTSKLMKDSLALSRQPFIRNSMLAGLQAALTGLVSLSLIYISPWSHLIGFAGLGTLVALYGRFATGYQRHAIIVQAGICQTLVVFLVSSVVWLGAPEYLQLIFLTILCGALLFFSNIRRIGIPGPLIFVFAAGASMTHHLSFDEVLQRTAILAAVSILAWVICSVTYVFSLRPSEEFALPTEPARPLSHLWVAAARTAVGCGLAIFVAKYILAVRFPAWAALGAMAVLQGVYLHISLNRALQRMVGTVLGSGIAWAILDQHASLWVIIVAIVILQFFTEIIIGINYALGQALVTPMALLMTSLGSARVDNLALVPERILDTIVGACVGILIAVILSSLDDRRYLNKVYQDLSKSDGSAVKR